MRQVIDIGAAPANADCAQLGQTRDFATINRHDFGNYLTLALEADDADLIDDRVIAYIEAVEDGLGSWLEAGFAPTIRYLAGGSATTDDRSFNDIVMGALRTTRPGEAGNWPVADFETLHTNLAAAFPVLADAVRAQMELAL